MARNRRYGGGLFPGVVLMVVGALFLLERADLMAMPELWQFWPLFIIWIGLVQLIKPDGGRRSIVWLLIGIWLQISTLELFGLDFSNSWPLVIIAVGASFVFDSLLKGSSGKAVRQVIVEVDAGIGVDEGRETTNEP